MDGRVTYVIDR